MILGPEVMQLLAGGSLGGMVVLLLYFFLSAAVLLIGAEVNATILPASASKDSGPERG
jgi:membrane protein